MPIANTAFAETLLCEQSMHRSTHWSSGNLLNSPAFTLCVKASSIRRNKHPVGPIIGFEADLVLIDARRLPACCVHPVYSGSDVLCERSSAGSRTSNVTFQPFAHNICGSYSLITSNPRASFFSACCSSLLYFRRYFFFLICSLNNTVFNARPASPCIHVQQLASHALMPALQLLCSSSRRDLLDLYTCSIEGILSRSPDAARGVTHKGIRMGS